MNSSAQVRVWDLPTRVFHWSLAASVVGLVITGNVGGNAMIWHFRFGYCVIALLGFRIIWGLVGGRWSRFASFIYSPKSVLAYLKGRANPNHLVGHNPLGAGSVFALLLFLVAQVSSGLMSDDEIAFAGPLVKFVSGATVSLATWYHKEVGKTVLIVLVVLHLAAIAFYFFKKKENLVKPMISGDKALAADVPASRDDLASRLLALVILAMSVTATTWLVKLGG
jgi:cytochrome b